MAADSAADPLVKIPSNWFGDLRTRRWLYTGGGRWQVARRMTKEELVALRRKLSQRRTS